MVIASLLSHGFGQRLKGRGAADVRGGVCTFTVCSCVAQEWLLYYLNILKRFNAMAIRWLGLVFFWKLSIVKYYYYYFSHLFWYVQLKQSLKGIVHPKMKCAHSPNVVKSFLCQQQNKIIKYLTVVLDFHSIYFSYFESHWLPSTVWLPTLFKISSFVLNRRKTRTGLEQREFE